MGCFTDPHFLRVAKSGKSPKRPALPGAVIRVWAVHRPTPFHLLLFHTLSAALIRAFFHSPNTGPTRAFWELGRVLSPPWVETRNNGPHGAQQAGTGDPSGSWLRGAKKAAAGFCLAAAFRSLFHVLEVSPTAPPKAEADPLRLQVRHPAKYRLSTDAGPHIVEVPAGSAPQVVTHGEVLLCV